MSENDSVRSAKALKQQFKSLDAGNGIYVYYEPEQLPVSYDTLRKLILTCKKNKIDCVIPCLPSDTLASGSVFALWSDLFDTLLTLAEKNGISVGLNLEGKLEECFFADDSPVPSEVRTSLCSRILNCREYYCGGGQSVSLKLGEYNVMAVSCYDEDMTRSMDLSEYVHNGVLEYTPDSGNYLINTYTCDTEDVLRNNFKRTVNKLSYESSLRYIELVFALLGERVTKHIGRTLCVLHMTDICFDAPNRRNWDESFNRRFEEIFNFPAGSLYDAMFHNVGEVTPHHKSLLMSCRSQMLCEGIYAALTDIAKKYKMELISGMAEPKLADSVWLNGDTMKNMSGSACARLEKAYMYGANSLKLASSSADCFGGGEVYCELYGGNYNFADRTAYKDAMNAYAGGCTRLLIHMPRDITRAVIENPDSVHYLDRIPIFSRCRALLSHGVSISDIGILFPTYSMNSEIYLYQSRENGFEYPNVLDNNDYMSVINILSYYCGQDPLLIHPDVLLNNCALSGSGIRMTVGDTQRDLKVLVLPGISVISLENMRMIAEFFDRGGKVIATGRLPRLAAEYHISDEDMSGNDFTNLSQYGTAADLEVRALVRHVFGAAANDNSAILEYYRNRNHLGGEAYYVCASRTSSDGTLYCNENLLRDILFSFKLPLDVYMSNLPSRMGYDALNDTYPNFSRLGFGVKFPGGGMIKHIHKKINGCEVYFFSNTSNNDYNGYVYLRGLLSPEALTPHDGKNSRLSPRYVSFNHEVYTAIKLELAPSRSVFIVATECDGSKIRTRDVIKISSVEHNFLTE